ncbi:hypothetical protein PV08_08565 [Exophiala spinifera]|uniref:Uncharacterized protein n=1 Tax=Exophiala spinifera TaxID=91928 RepID=A0A0D1ZKM0_9EURO|nr:uncharacterized protein PV08_08565 [Exophiala spinifera]KIW13377.1 hypothetical protein PV08_08565 [Exophiala spinifera]
MNTTRLRKAFKYPSDDEGTDASHDEMDEQEQESLLKRLRASESSTNAQYTLIFTALPLIVTLPFAWYLFIATSRIMALLCLLSITSLGSSAYIMSCMPVSSSSANTSSSGLGGSGQRRRLRPPPPPPSVVFGTGTARGSQNEAAFSPFSSFSSFFATSPDDGPVKQYLPYLNAATGVILLVAAMGYRARTDVPEGLWLFLVLPAVVFGMVVMARRNIGDIQVGLSELQGMRYEYKGA